MRHLLSNLPLGLGDEGRPPAQILAEHLGGGPGDYGDARLERLSLDARHKGSIRWLVSLSFDSPRDFQDVQDLALPPGARLEAASEPPSFQVSRVPVRPRVIVVGTGPAGSFCALRLLDYGIEPLVLERGPEMAERVRAVEGLWSKGILDPEANAQFGEGGAGTFSDGKLATRVNHPAIRYVLEAFVRFGAPPRILHLAKPHVGTDLIRACMVKLRQEVLARGGRYRFRTRLADLRVREGRVVAAVLASGEEIPCDAVVLALGHSARDGFAMLRDLGVPLRSKAFAMGVRIEHPQELIDRSQYGPRTGHPSLPVADYRLVCNLDPRRAVYSFCMCPGGEVIQCASEEGGSVVNGMSNSGRDSGYANSGLVAKVGPWDFPSEDPLAGVAFQREWERRSFRLGGGGYAVPAQTVPAFLKGRLDRGLPESTFRPHLQAAPLEEGLPPTVAAQLREALPQLERKLRGFTSAQALMLGLESRTSSPIQIPREEDGCCPGFQGLYPCGEGAGHAGGITSAAVDGIRVAEWIAMKAGAEVFQAFQRRTGSEPGYPG